MTNKISGVVYVIEFSPPIAGHARFYVGSTALLRLGERFREHLTGRGAKITRWASNHNVVMTIKHTVPTDTLRDARKLEQKIKRGWKSTPRWLKAQGAI